MDKETDELYELGLWILIIIPFTKLDVYHLVQNMEGRLHFLTSNLLKHHSCYCYEVYITESL